MRDFDRVKDGKGNSNFKPVIIFIIICLIIVGAIAYIIINLTSQYNFLNEQYAKVQRKVMKIGSDITPEKLFKKDGKQAQDNSKNLKVAINDKKEKSGKAQIKNGQDKKKSDEIEIEEVTSKEEVIAPKEIIAKQIDKHKETPQNINNYYLLQLIEGKNINEANAVVEFYSKYFDNLHIKQSGNKSTFIVRCCTTENLDKIKLNKSEVKRRFNINPEIIKVSEWLYKDSGKKEASRNINYVLQLSSNTTRKEASDIMNFYKQYYFDTYITTDKVNNAQWYRVRCCFAPSIDEAEKRVLDIKDRFNVSPIIIATKDETYKIIKPEFKYVLELNRKKSLKDAREIVEFYSSYLKDTYISKDKDESGNDIYSIKCCISQTEREAENIKNNLKDRFNILSDIMKVDLKKEERIEPANSQEDVSKAAIIEGDSDNKSKVHYVLQLASNRVEKETLDMAKFYKKYIKDITVISQKSDTNTVWYKVRSCTSDSLEEANKKLLELKEQFNIEPIIVKTIE
jgi:hypothetical protein